MCTHSALLHFETLENFWEEAHQAAPSFLAFCAHLAGVSCNPIPPTWPVLSGLLILGLEPWTSVGPVLAWWGRVQLQEVGTLCI
jgi:hypothetical protein